MAIVLLAAALWAAPARGTSILPRTVVDLIHFSEFILVGTVVEVHDGFNAEQLPYTQITLRVDEALKGDAPGTYTFRQFGLLEPRVMPDGRTNLMLSPDGWPSFRAGEDVVVFLYKAAQHTGFRTTVGLMQGKFTVRDGQVENAVGNRGLFARVRVEKSLLSSTDSKLLRARSGPVAADAFLSFVRNTIRNRWIERGEVSNAR
jgi:hypothetical protein